MFIPNHGLVDTDSSIDDTLQAVCFAVKAGVVIALGIFLYGGICSSVKAFNMPSGATVTGGSAVWATLTAALFAVGAYLLPWDMARMYELLRSL